MEEKKKKSGLCIAALVIGIVSIFWVPGTLLGLAAVIMGIIGLAKHKSPKGCAVWAIILGGFTTIVKNIFASD